MYASYNVIPELIRGEVPFKGNSVSAHKVGTEYVVKSYYTTILRTRNGQVVEFNNEYYSRTTSRLQRIIKYIYKLDN